MKLIARRLIGLIALPFVTAWSLIVLVINAVSLIAALPVLIAVLSAKTCGLILEACAEIYVNGAKDVFKRLLVID